MQDELLPRAGVDDAVAAVAGDGSLLAISILGPLDPVLIGRQRRVLASTLPSVARGASTFESLFIDVDISLRTVRL